MQTVTTKAIAKVAAVATGLAMATSMLSFAPMVHAASLTNAQVQSILSLLSSFGANAATISNVNAALTGQPSTTTTGSTTTTTGTSSCTFSRSLTIGSTGADVTCLQQALIGGGFSIPAGATGYFGTQTRAAVASWQSSKNIAPAVGFFGPISRAAFNLGGGSSNTNTTTTTTTTTTGAGTGNGLKISLAATSPNGTVLIQGQGIGDLADFVFANPTASPINVTALSFKRIGSSNDSTLTNVYLFNGGTRITDSAGVSSSAFTYSDPVALFTVPAGQTYTVSVRSDILSTAQGQQIGVQLVSATSNGTLDSSVSFPINGGYQTVSAATLATVSYVASASTIPTADTSVSPQANYPVWQNTITVSTNPVNLSSLKFTNLGSIDSAYVSNLRLYVDGVQVGAAVANMGTGRTVTFDLSAAPKALSTQSHVVKVLADLTGGSARTIQFSVQRSSDGMFVDSQLGQPVTPTVANATFSAVTAHTITISAVTSTSGVSVSLDPASPSSNVPVGASSVKWATFDMLASGENVKVSDLYVSASSTLSTGALAGVGGLNNGKIFLNGVQVGSTKDIGSLTAATTDFSLGSSLILPAGTVVKVDIYADAQDTAGTNLADSSTVVVALDVSASNAQGQSSLVATNVPAAKTIGNSVTVSSSSVTATKYSGYGNQTLLAGSTALLGSFSLASGSTEGITVNTIQVNLISTNAASITNLTLKDHATGAQIGTIVTTPSTANSFSVGFDIPASQTKTIDIYGNILAGSNSGNIILGVDYTTGGTGDITGTAATVGASNTVAAVAGVSPLSATLLQTISVGVGALTVAVGSGNPTSANVIAGSSNVLAGQFTFTAQYSAYTVDELAILVPVSSATSVSAITLTYKDVNGATQTATQGFAAVPSVGSAQAYATATFTGLTMYVPANNTSNVNVSVNIPTVAAGATSGAKVNVLLSGIANAFGGNGFRAKNSAGTATTTLVAAPLAADSVSGQGDLVVRRSIPTLTAVPLSTTLTNATQEAIGRVKISADPAGDVSWGKIVFTIAKDAATQLGATTTVKVYNITGGGSSVVAGTFATTTGPTTTSGVAIDILGTNVSGSLIFVPTLEQQIAAGQNATYELRANVTGVSVGGGTSYINTSIAYASTADTAPTTGTFAALSDSATAPLGAATKGFVWSDRSSINPIHSLTSSDWTNDYLLTGLPLSLANQST